jgi:hypothetical protein
VPPATAPRLAVPWRAFAPSARGDPGGHTRAPVRAGALRLTLAMFGWWVLGVVLVVVSNTSKLTLNKLTPWVLWEC